MYSREVEHIKGVFICVSSLSQHDITSYRVTQDSLGFHTVYSEFQYCDHADLDTTFVSFENSLPQPEIK